MVHSKPSEWRKTERVSKWKEQTGWISEVTGKKA